LDASLKSVHRRLAALEDRLDVDAAARSELTAGIPTLPSPQEFGEILSNHFDKVSGRVLIGDLHEVQLLRSLRDAGIDIYGVTSTDALVPEVVDVRQENLFDHLGDLQNDSLGGFVLSGIPDRGSVNEQLRALRLLLLKCKPGAAVAVIVVHPETWATQLGPVAADLLHGRPMHAETWSYLLTREDASHITVTEASDSSYCLVTAHLP